MNILKINARKPVLGMVLYPGSLQNVGNMFFTICLKPVTRVIKGFIDLAVLN